MVTRQDYFNLKDAALDHYDYLLHVQPTGTDIVFIVTDDILVAIHNHDMECQVCVPEEFLGERVHTRLCGTDIVLVRGDALGTLFVAAIRCNGRLQIDTRVANGTYLITDGCLYRFEAATSRFVGIDCEVLSGVDLSAANVAMPANDVASGIQWNFDDIAQANISIDYDALYNAMLSTRSVKAKKPKETTLDPGDTKMLDEFLNSFAQKGFLREA